MGDKRTDPGHYYPGGRVRAKSGTAPQELIVQWSDVQGKPQIAPLPNRYRDSDVKDKINEIASKFTTVVVAALIGWSACADVTVQKKRKDEIYNDEMVVVDVTGGGGFNTNAVRDIVRDVLATNGIRSVDGAARPLPKYLHTLDFDDSYAADAERYYELADVAGGCSARATMAGLERNFDFPYDERAEFVITMRGNDFGRLASVGVANVGTNITEQMVTSGKQLPPQFYKALPGATVDGINECGVVAEINVVPVNGAEWETKGSRDINAIGAVRWALNFAPTAEHAATNLAKRVYIPESMKRKGYSCHFMIADENSAWIVEDGVAHRAWSVTNCVVMTNFRLYGDDPYGTGRERYALLEQPQNSITSAWFRAAYRRPFARPSEFAAPGIGRWDETGKLLAWAEANIPQGAPETLRRGGGSWQTLHTSVYDFNRKTLKICVQEQNDWYTFAVPSTGGKSVEIDPTLSEEGKAADAYATGQAIQNAGKVKKVANVEPNADGNVPLTASSVGAFPATSGQTLQQAVQVISVHLNAEDAKDVITNYDSTVNMPSRRLEYKIPDGPDAGTWRVVWDELTRWNWLIDDYLPTNYYTKAEVDARTDHVQWGLFDSQTGNFSPEKTVQISSDRVILCKGASYQRTATAQGSYWVWTSNEPYSITGVESNGYFRIEDAEGNTTFEIVKGDKVTAAATAGGVTTEQVMGITHLHISYPIEADTHPTLEICNDLNTHDWRPETDPTCKANVVWSGASGNYTAEVWGKLPENAMFVKATYERGSDTYVRYAQAISLQTVKIGNTIYYVGTATIGGHTVLTLSLTPQ